LENNTSPIIPPPKNAVVHKTEGKWKQIVTRLSNSVRQNIRVYQQTGHRLMEDTGNQYKRSLNGVAMYNIRRLERTN
jgi:hypothetical protein